MVWACWTSLLGDWASVSPYCWTSCLSVSGCRLMTRICSGLQAPACNIPCTKADAILPKPKKPKVMRSVNPPLHYAFRGTTASQEAGIREEGEGVRSGGVLEYWSIGVQKFSLGDDFPSQALGGFCRFHKKEFENDDENESDN